MRTRFFWLVLALLLACGDGDAASTAPRLQAQPQPREFTVADGLPSSTIRAITEDRFGYLWFASTDGLARYDGRGFRIWRTEHGLRDNGLWSLHVDASNQLWVGTNDAGLVVLSADRRHFRYYDRKSYPQIGSNTVWAITSTADGAIWFGTSNAGLYRLAPDGSIRGFLPEADNPRSLPSRAVGQLAVTGDGQLWVGTQNGVARWTGVDFERIDTDKLPSRLINSLTVDRDGALWIGTTAGLVVRDAEGHIAPPLLHAEQDPAALHLLAQDSRGDLWLDTLLGLGWSHDGSNVANVPLFGSVDRGLVRPSWSVGYEDREGGLWFGSLDFGLWHLPANWRQFIQIPAEPNNPQALHNPRVTSMAGSSSDGLWLVGTRGDLDHLDPRSGRIEHHLGRAAGNTWLRAVAEDTQGRVWLGSYHLLLRYDPRSGELRRWEHDDADDPATPGTISQIVPCQQDLIWVRSGEGGLQARRADGHVLWSAPPGSEAVGTGLVLSMLCGPDDRIWLGTDAGLARWNTQAQRFDPVPGSPRLPVHALRFSDDGVLWVGHTGALGLYQWQDRQLRLLDRIDADNEFPALTPNGLVIDSQGVAWVSSARGLLRVDPASRAVRLYSVHDGLRSQEFAPATLGSTSRGQVYAATGYGVVLMDPAALLPPSRRPALVVERVTARDGDSLKDLTHLTPLVIGAGMRDVQVTARLLSFADSAANLYRFRLDGYDPDWVEVGASGERMFSRLRSGNHRLLLQARTADNLWSPVQELRFRVQPPWWASTVGIVIYVLLGGLLVVAGLAMYRRRVQRASELALAHRTQELAEQASLAKTRFLANLGHEVRTPLTGVLGMSELLLASPLEGRERGYARSIQQAGEHLLRLVNDALDLARIEAGKLELQQNPVDLRALIDQVVELMAPLARNKGLAFELDCRLPARLSVTGDAVRLRQIMLNLLGNAIKFTAAGKVGLQVSVGARYNGLSIAVHDSGPGIADAQKQRLFQRFEQAEGARTAERYGGSGLGLAICHELAVAMGGGISVDSQPGHGAHFRVELPLPWQQLPAQPAPAPVAASGPPRSGLSILLVEDEATIAEVVSGLLQARGHQVVHAGHALAALAELAGSDFDIALLDLDLPGLDGLSLARQIRAMGHYLPLLAVTARADAEAQQQALDSGCNGFLRKPVTGQLLDDAIVAACAACAAPAEAEPGLATDPDRSVAAGEPAQPGAAGSGMSSPG